jgi:Cell wall-associated hydrolases (invasion-associated proteins)
MKSHGNRSPSRLRFSDEEKAAPALKKPIAKAEKATDKHEAAQSKIPTKKKIVRKRMMDEAGKKVSRLSFEETKVKPPSKLQHPISKPITSALTRQANASNEDDNVGTTSALQTERAGESVLQMGEHAYHAHKLKPYRDAEKTAKTLDKANDKHLKAKQRQDQPQFSSNPFSRWQQKRTIRKEYAAARAGKTTKTVKNANNAAKKTASATDKVIGSITKKPKTVLLVGLAVLLMCVMNMASSMMPLAQTVVNAFIMGTYPATEDDVRAAERAYAAKEKELSDELKHYESRHPGYDEYVITAQEIWHDPYALIAIISAYYDGNEWTIDNAYPVIEKYFNLQYILTENVVTETRYRKEERTGQRLVTDPITGESAMESYAYDVQVPYSYTICQVTLENRDLSHMPVYSMSHHTMGLYALYMSTLGNMPDLFAGNPHASQLRDPLLYDIPEEVLAADEQFATLMKEANKYVGYPYVWGGASPETSFDCSGFVSYIFTNSGVYDTGRLGATGLYGICRKITANEVRPGDLIFFQGTMGADVGGITHVGIVVGNNMMIHCGNPIGYADLTDSYWQRNFFGYGRIPY